MTREHHLLDRVEALLVTAEQILTTQAQVQADINGAVSALNGFLQNVADVIAELQAGDVTIDTSKLNQVVQQLPALQSALDSVTAPAPGTTSTTTATTTTTAAPSAAAAAVTG